MQLLLCWKGCEHRGDREGWQELVVCVTKAVRLQLRPPIKINPSIHRPSQVRPVASHPNAHNNVPGVHRCPSSVTD